MAASSSSWGGHVGHGTARREIGEDDLLPRSGEHVRGFGHEVHAAEDDVFGVDGGCLAGKFEAVADDVAEFDDRIGLVVVREDGQALPERGSSRARSFESLVLGEVADGPKIDGGHGGARYLSASGDVSRRFYDLCASDCPLRGTADSFARVVS